MQNAGCRNDDAVSAVLCSFCILRSAKRSSGTGEAAELFVAPGQFFEQLRAGRRGIEPGHLVADGFRACGVGRRGQHAPDPLRICLSDGTRTLRPMPTPARCTRLARGGDERGRRAAAENRLRQLRAGVDGMLAIVEDQQRVAWPQESMTTWTSWASGTSRKRQ